MEWSIYDGARMEKIMATLCGGAPNAITKLNSLFLYRQTDEFVSRVGIYPPLPDAEKVQFVAMNEPDKKGDADQKSEYRKLYL